MYVAARRTLVEKLKYARWVTIGFSPVLRTAAPATHSTDAAVGHLYECSMLGYLTYSNTPRTHSMQLVAAVGQCTNSAKKS